MNKSKFIGIISIILVALALRILVTFYQGTIPNFRIQQDNYADYATALSRGFSSRYFFTAADARLFPGYPILIFLLSRLMLSTVAAGYIISLLSSLSAIYLFWLLTENALATWIFAILPPIWIAQSVKVATEPVTVLLLLISVILYKKKKIFYSGVILGLATDVRLISVCLLAAIALRLLFSKKRHEIVNLTLGFMPVFSLLFAYNYLVFGNLGIFQQFHYNAVVVRTSVGFIQIFKDFVNAILKKEYRTLLSGFFYILISMWGIIGLYSKRKLSDFNNLCYYWALLSLLFIFAYGPIPLLGEYRRFLVPVIPALILGIVPSF